MALYQFFKPMEGNSQLNPPPVRDADEVVELCVRVKPSSKCRNEHAEFIPQQQANIARYACMYSSPTEASHSLEYIW